MLKTFEINSCEYKIEPRSFFTSKSSIFQWRWSSHWSTVRPVRVDSSYFRAQTRRLSHRSDGKRRQTTRSRNIVTDGCNPVRLVHATSKPDPSVRISNPCWFFGQHFIAISIDIGLLDHPIFLIYKIILKILVIWNNYQGSEN